MPLAKRRTPTEFAHDAPACPSAQCSHVLPSAAAFASAPAAGASAGAVAVPWPQQQHPHPHHMLMGQCPRMLMRMPPSAGGSPMPVPMGMWPPTPYPNGAPPSMSMHKHVPLPGSGPHGMPMHLPYPAHYPHHQAPHQQSNPPPPPPQPPPRQPVRASRHARGTPRCVLGQRSREQLARAHASGRPDQTGSVAHARPSPRRCCCLAQPAHVQPSSPAPARR